MFALFYACLLLTWCLECTAGAGAGKRLVLEMDFEQEIINLKNEISGLKTQLSHSEAVQKQNEAYISAIQKQLGSTYTRWGRTTCPANGTSLVYSGYMAGTYHDSSKGTQAAGANYLCLADKPTWDHYSETVNNDIRVTSVEYEFYSHTVRDHDLTAFFGSDVFKDDAPCSVCRSQRSTNVMIPGRKDCYPGWTKEYSGYLVGAYQGYDDATEYVCLDRRPETVVNSGIRYTDNMLYFVEATCGKGLACPPYHNNRELACVVCSM